MKIRGTILFALLPLLVTSLVVAAEPRTAKVLLVTGIDHPAHQWKQTAPFLAQMLQQDPRLSVRVVEDPKFLASPQVQEYDAIVLNFQNWQVPDPGEEARANLQHFVEGGKGLVLVHFACGAFHDWPEYRNIAGRVWDPAARPHDPRGPFHVRLSDAEHPITHGLGEFDTDDELYTCLTGDREVKVLATARSKVDGKEYPMALVNSYGKGRTFECTLGHDVKALTFPAVQALYRRGAAWAAGLPVLDEVDAAAAILTPPAPAKPRINGPNVYGLRPGSPLIFRIPATGQRPMSFAAEHLPAGLTLDAESGILTGKLAERGEHVVTLIARNSQGECRRPFKIVIGDTLALTPPMGWNSWYIHYNRVTDADVRAAADAMVASGMADYGYQYVNIDDCWPMKPGSKDPALSGPPRDTDGRVRPNAHFPDMKALTDYIHAKGLKAGIYTSPGPTTCGRYEGSYQHEALDARTFGEWGFDFLKYDWCSYTKVAGGKSIDDLKKPYKLMSGELHKLDRDVVFNLCQYGMGKVWEWGGEVGNCWRTTGDLGLEGGSLSAGIYKIGLFNATLADHAGPGHWNDPDYILIGWVGDARKMGEGHPTTLTPDEQYTQMSMWCLMASPLIFSGDMTKLDPFTLNVLCNHEVIEVDQDSLGRQARIVRKTPDVLVLCKEMEDGSKAVGLFNLSTAPAKLAVDWKELGLGGAQRVRDLWRQKDVGTFPGEFAAEVPAHGVALVRVIGAK